LKVSLSLRGDVELNLTRPNTHLVPRHFATISYAVKADVHDRELLVIAAPGD
jgi:hypothetical protein